MTVRTWMAALAIATVTTGGALAAEDPDAPMPTSGGEAPGVDAQIDEYLRTSPAAQAVPAPEDAPGERRVHGVIELGVGSGGYRSVYIEGHAPLGKNGGVSVAVGETRNDRGLGLGCHGRGWTGTPPLGPGPCLGPILGPGLGPGPFY